MKKTRLDLTDNDLEIPTYLTDTGNAFSQIGKKINKEKKQYQLNRLGLLSDFM